ncbi:MAG: PKD domain-containing protein [Bacteroidota bacterium]
MRNLYLLLIILLWGIWNPLKGQSDPDILLQSGRINPPENILEFLSETIPQSEQIGGYYYRFIQFKEAPSQTLQDEIRRAGVRIYAYVPHQTYLVAIPTSFDRSKLINWGVGSVLRLAVEHKIQQRLQNEDFPHWAIKGDKVDLVIRFKPEMAAYRFQQLMQTKGFKILKNIEGEKEIHLRCPLTKISEIAAMEAVLFVEAAPEPGQAEDVPARNLQRSNWLSSYAPMGRKYDGAGINIMVRDDGEVGPHIDFQGRLDQSQISGNLVGSHGDGVAGVMGSAGNLRPRAKGGASAANLWVLDYEPSFTDNTLALHQSQDVMITNSSYSNGCNAGYTASTQRVDRQTYQNPSLLHIFSAGNSNYNNCNYGAGTEWGNITGGHKTGKNVIATANLFEDASIVGSSSRGPATDGRIKPDMAAHGQGELSTSPNHSYFPFGGTSAASPTGAGLMAQLYQAYRELNANAYPASGLMKAIVMNTARDLGNPGPDFTHGWGLYHGLRAVKVLEEVRYLENILTQGDTMSHTITIPAGVQEARIMLYWTDPEGSLLSSRALVNDLELRVLDNSGAIKYPLILDHTPDPVALAAAAVPGVDSINNVEQVRLASPQAGVFQIQIEGKEVPIGPQKYFLTYEFLFDETLLTYPTGGESMVPSEVEMIHWDAAQGTEPFTLEVSYDNGGQWNLIANNIDPAARTYDWTVPNNLGGRNLIRITRGQQTASSSEPFSISEIPNNVTVDQVCPTYTRLSWSAIPGVIAYDVFILGNKFMDSVGTTTNNSIDLPNINPTVGHWYSVRGVGVDGMKGRRAEAVFHPAGFLNCNITSDIHVGKLAEPLKNRYNLCEDSLSVEVWLYNEGAQAESNIPLHYRLGANIQIDEVFTGTVNSGDSILYSFAQKIDLAFFNGYGGEYELMVWQDQILDQNYWNDTLSKSIQLMDQVISPIYREDFEGFPLCGTLNDCGVTVCELSNGWINVANGIGDDIDWRTHQGPTSSSNTGPTLDHFPGTLTGNYLYLESSFCANKEAYLISPCIDLTNAIAPAMSFWYHLFGNDIGSLSVDIYDGLSWQNDVISPLVGDQGPDWLEAEIDLTSYLGKVIQLRFRANSGGGWQGDLAIDDVLFFDLGLPPAIDFTADRVFTCPGDPVIFEPQTSPGIVSYNWTFNPTTVSFLNGTSALSAQPEVSFDVPGLYTVALNASTNLAANTFVKMSYVQVDDIGINLPLQEDFESGVFPPTDWFVINPDTSFGFGTTAGIGVDGIPSNLTFVNNALYGDLGEEDYLQSSHIDLSTISNPWLSFDVAYAPHSINHMDSLRIDLSLDCGLTWTNTIYLKGGMDLGTTATNPIPWSPNTASDWRRDSVDLSAWVGSSINLRFVNINHFGNNLFLDNISLDGDPTQAPIASFYTNKFQTCAEELIQISDNSIAVGGTYNWDFGQDAVPASANHAGPHQVQWLSAGVKTITLTVSNALGSTNYSQQVQIDPLPEANFSYAYINNHQVAFNNMSTNANAQFWDFGDGSSSSLFSPSHAFLANGTYRVRLLTINSCGTDTLDQYVTISGITVPNVNFTSSSAVLCEAETFTFHDQSQGIGITQYHWDFGPGASPATANTAGPHQVSYVGPGPRTVTLSVANGSGTGVHTSAISVSPLPQASFTENQTAFNTFIFANSSLYGSTYLWDFGDGNTTSNVAPTYSYLSNGNFTVSLVVGNNCGLDTFQQTLTVSGIQSPQAEMSILNTTVCQGDTIHLLDQSQGIGINAYNWDFGVGAFPASSTLPGPHQIIYNTPGTKLIQLSVANGTGISLDSQYVEILPPPAPAGINASLQNGQSWLFSPDSLQIGDSYLWDFGDGQQSVQVTPLHTYVEGGEYVVKLILENQCGKDTASIILVVGSVSIEAPLADLQLRIAPNPSQEQFELLVEGAEPSALALQLWDTKGRIVRAAKHQHNGGKSSIGFEVGNMPAGLYLLQISRDGTSVYRRVLVY